jgi:hypothetical protein
MIKYLAAPILIARMNRADLFSDSNNCLLKFAHVHQALAFYVTNHASRWVLLREVEVGILDLGATLQTYGLKVMPSNSNIGGSELGHFHRIMDLRASRFQRCGMSKMSGGRPVDGT